jgi:hypothetical protein
MSAIRSPAVRSPAHDDREKRARHNADEAAQIPRRTPILERLHEREQQNMEYGGIDK